MPAKCSAEPVAGIPKDDLPGLAFAQVTKSLTVRTESGRAALAAAVGRPDAADEQIRRAIAVIENSGAVEAVEAEIAALMDEAQSLIAALDIAADGREHLARLLTRWGDRSA